MEREQVNMGTAPLFCSDNHLHFSGFTADENMEMSLSVIYFN